MIRMRWRKAKLLQEDLLKIAEQTHREQKERVKREREFCEEEKFVISLYERYTQCTGIYSQPKNPESSDHP